MYKLIVSDIDLTLLNSEFLIPQYNIDMIHRAMDAGIQFMVCTGRFFGSARPYCKFLGVDTPIISSNGAALVDYYTWEPISAKPIPEDVCCEVFDMLDQLRVHYHFYTEKRFYAREGLNDGTFKGKMTQNLPEDEMFETLETGDPCGVARSERVFKIACRIPDPEQDRRFREKFCKYEKLSITSSFTHVYELQAAGVNKGAALKEYAEMQGIRPEEILAVGDNYNDIEMIRYAGTGVAVGNAMDVLKEAADYISDTAENSGVGKAIAKFVFGEEPEETVCQN